MGLYRYGGKVFAGSKTKRGAKIIASRYRKKYGKEVGYSVHKKPSRGDVKRDYPSARYVVVAKRKD